MCCLLHSYGYPGGYSPYFGGSPGGFYGQSAYGPGFGGYQQYPGGYGGGFFRNTRNTKLSKDLDIDIN